MRITTTIFAACLCITIVNAWPLDTFRSRALDRLMVSETENDSALRNKRTIGLLRQFFPDISKRIEDKVNAIIGEIFKIFGPAVIGNILGGANKNNAAAAKSQDGSTVEVKSPFDDDTDDFFNAPVKEDQVGTRVKVDLPKFDADNEVTSSSTTTTTTTEAAKVTTINEQSEETTIASAENATPSVVFA